MPHQKETPPYLTIPAAGEGRRYGFSEFQLREMVVGGRVPAWAIRRTGRKAGRVYLSRAWLEGAERPPSPVAEASPRRLVLVEAA